MVLMPKAVSAKEPKTCKPIPLKALRYLSFKINPTISALKVEKVVSVPKKPVTSKSLHMGSRLGTTCVTPMKIPIK